MFSSDAVLRWVGLAVAASLPLGLNPALADGKAPDVAVVHVRGGPPAAFAEVPDPEPDQRVTIEPVGPAASSPAPVRRSAVPGPAPAVAVAPPPPVRVAVKPATLRPVEPMIEGQAPPLAVSIAFAKYRTSARMQADALAQTLRGLGISVEEVAVGTVRVRTPRVGYIFAADRPAALAISVNAGAQYGFVDPVSMPFSVVPGARPGLIAIILPG